MSLSDLTIKREYRTFKDDVPHDFYVPLLKQAVLYQRAVGFFSSTSLSSLTPGLCGLVLNDGQMEIVASPKLSAEDVRAINCGYEARGSIVSQALIRELQSVEDAQAERLNLLANLIAAERLTIKIVTTKQVNGLGMYHEKLGLIRDASGNVVAFSGSMNETITGFQKNYEAFDVYCSWLEADRERVRGKQAAFAAIWQNEEPDLEVQEFPEVNQSLIEKYSTGPVDWEAEADKQDRRFEENNPILYKSGNHGLLKPLGVNFYDYQQDAIDRWLQADGRGIFDMATGTGKTYTGLGAAAALCKRSSRLAIIIVCPYQHLVRQWADDVRAFGMEPIIAYSGSEQKDYKKRIRSAVLDFNLNVKAFFCLVCTNATFATAYVQESMQRLGNDTLLMVDEAHNFGAERLKATLRQEFQYRLALSATFERHHDAEGTAQLERFFGKRCIEYGLKRAIAEGRLTPYEYHPVPVVLTVEERERYLDLTRQIGRCIIKKRNGKKELNEKGKKLAMERARLVAGAAAKGITLKDLMQEHLDDHYMLVYCGAARLLEQADDEIVIDEDIRQVDYISRMLNFDLGMETAQFTSRENAQERQSRLQDFADGEIQALVAIRCLDEGVNVPAIRTAFILASTTNPKEYIQRRGRVLRRYPGKEKAVIYDFVTLPRALDEVVSQPEEMAQQEKGLIKNELSRMKEFMDLSMQPQEGERLYDEMVDAYELYDFAAQQITDDTWEE